MENVILSFDRKKTMFRQSIVVPVGDDAYIVPYGNYRNGMALVVRTVCRFADRVDVGIDPYDHKCNCLLSNVC